MRLTPVGRLGGDPGRTRNVLGRRVQPLRLLGRGWSPHWENDGRERTRAEVSPCTAADGVDRVPLEDDYDAPVGSARAGGATHAGFAVVVRVARVGSDTAGASRRARASPAARGVVGLVARDRLTRLALVRASGTPTCTGTGYEFTRGTAKRIGLGTAKRIARGTAKRIARGTAKRIARGPPGRIAG